MLVIQFGSVDELLVHYEAPHPYYNTVYITRYIVAGEPDLSPFVSDQSYGDENFVVSFRLPYGHPPHSIFCLNYEAPTAKSALLVEGWVRAALLGRGAELFALRGPDDDGPPVFEFCHAHLQIPEDKDGITVIADDYNDIKEWEDEDEDTSVE